MVRFQLCIRGKTSIFEKKKTQEGGSGLHVSEMG